MTDSREPPPTLPGSLVQDLSPDGGVFEMPELTMQDPSEQSRLLAEFRAGESVRMIPYDELDGWLGFHDPTDSRGHGPW